MNAGSTYREFTIIKKGDYMNKVAHFLLTGFVLLVITIFVSIAFTQTSARKMLKQDANTAVRVVLAK
jgi:hypothetical protein